VLAHDSLRFLDTTAAIKADCPFANCSVAFDATVWSPQVGMKLAGKVNLCSPDHISLLVHRTFNVSIPRHHIPVDEWEFEYGPVENDPEFGAIDDAEAPAEGSSGAEIVAESGGRWIHKVTGTKLGGDKGDLEFTVVGLTVANQMLSLVGSVQPDPFSPEHVPSHQTPVASSSRPQRAAAALATLDEPDDDQVDDELLEGGSDDEEDTFAMLGRRGDEAVKRDAERRAKEEEAAKKERKRKRKEAKALGADTAADEPPQEKRAKKKKRAS